jgi:hypothetical protein
VPTSCELQLDAPRALAWQARISGACSAEIAFEADTTITPPVVADGLVAALLPVAMRAGATVLKVRAPISRGAMWRLNEFAQIWHAWAPGEFTRTQIEADDVRANLRPVDGPAVVACSGSLASAHSLVRLHGRQIAGAPDVGAILRIIGLRPGDDQTIDAERRAAESMNVRFITIRTNALSNRLIVGRIGRLPVIAGAMHALSGTFACGVHARGHLLTAHRFYPRPGPALPDVLGGDAFPILTDGGFDSPTTQARDIAKHSALAAAVQTAAAERSHAEQTLVRLAFRAAGHAGRNPIALLRDAVGSLALPLANPIITAEAESISQHWPAREGIAWVSLALRVSLRRTKVWARDFVRWLLSATKLAAVYPR